MDSRKDSWMALLLQCPQSLHRDVSVSGFGRPSLWRDLLSKHHSQGWNAKDRQTQSLCGVSTTASSMNRHPHWRSSSQKVFGSGHLGVQLLVCIEFVVPLFEIFPLNIWVRKYVPIDKWTYCLMERVVLRWSRELWKWVVSGALISNHGQHCLDWTVPGTN